MAMSMSEKRKNKIEVNGTNFRGHIKMIEGRLYHLLACVWPIGDTRKVPQMKMLEKAVWTGAYSWVDVDEDTIALDQYSLENTLSTIESLVSCCIGAFFTEEEQCEQLKHLVNRAVWISYKQIWRQEEPQESGYW